MTSRSDILIVCARVEDLSEDKIRGTLNKVKRKASCTFCSSKVWINTSNLSEQVGKGYNPVLLCAKCYGEQKGKSL